MMNVFFSDDVRRDPYPWYDEVREASPVLRGRRCTSMVLRVCRLASPFAFESRACAEAAV